MTTATKREKLHVFIDTADDQQIKAFYNKIGDYITGKSGAADSSIKMEKLEALKRASTDPLFLADLKEISDDFDAI